MNDWTLSRRKLLRTTGIMGVGALVLGGGVLGLSTCNRTAGEDLIEDLTDLNEQPGPYSVWREIQTHLRSSPDHAAGRAAALVGAGDVAAIHRFVRDEIRLISADGERFVLGSYVRWGKRAALRAGAGTAREKAEILADMIRQTGRIAEIVETDTVAKHHVAATFFRDMGQDFEPPIDSRIMENWRSRLGDRPPETVSVDLRTQEGKVAATSSEIRRLVSEHGLPRAWGRYNERAYERVPIVRFRDEDGGVFYADPIRPDAEIISEVGPVHEAAAPAGILPVQVSLSFTTTENPDSPVEIARGEWTAEEICGRQLRVGFKPLQKTAELLVSRVGDLRTFTPFLSIQALDGEEMEMESAVVMGKTFTLSGDVLTLQEGTTVAINGEDIEAGTRSERPKDVVLIEMKADATRYPDMRLQVWPRDAEGKIVDGLIAGEFSISDQGQPMSHLLRVQDRAPSILFLSDSSLSMPREYRGDTGESMAALVERVRLAGRAIHPKTSVSVRKTNSNLWENVVKSLGTKVDLIVYATDGHVKGWVPSAEERAPLAFGPPIITMNVNGDLDRWRQRSGSNVFDEMASLTNGHALEVVDGDDSSIEQAITAFLRETGHDLPYVLSYHVPGGERGIRTASVSIGSATGSGQYDAAPERLPPRLMASLRLTVSVGDREVVRVIGGHEGPAPVSQADIDNLCGSLLGTHLLAFEGPPPSFSTIMDDVLTARLSLEALDRAVSEEGSPEVIQALDKGHHDLPGELATLMMRAVSLSGEGFCFAEQGMRCVYYACHPVLNADKVTTRVDILPTSKTYVISPQADVRLQKSVEAGLWLAAAEGALFPAKNTFSLLDGKDLTEFREALYEANNTVPERQASWEYSRGKLREIFSNSSHLVLCAQDLSTQARWVIDMETGEVYALLPDLSGGGEKAQRIERQLSELDRVVSMLNLLLQAVGASGTLNPVGAHSLSMVVGYGQNLARLYAAASMAVILMDDSGIEPAVKKAIANMACENVKSISLGLFGAAGKSAKTAVEIFTMTENVAGAAGASSPFSCPI